jgi:hypothetical protein
MFGADKRIVLALMIGLLASSSWGCSALIAGIGIDTELDLYHPQTRAEVREKFGEADETRTCPGGQIVEHRWIRKKVDFIFSKDLFQVTYGLSEIFLFGITLYESEKQKIHYAFVYDDKGRLLYLYDLKLPPFKQFHYVMNPLGQELYKQLEEGNCVTWTACVTMYEKEARDRANCIGYTFDDEDEREFEDLRTICEWVDLGQVSCEEGLNDFKETITCRRVWFRY